MARGRARSPRLETLRAPDPAVRGARRTRPGRGRPPRGPHEGAGHPGVPRGRSTPPGRPGALPCGHQRLLRRLRDQRSVGVGHFLHAILAHVEPGGLFATAALHRSRGYLVGGRFFPSADLREADLRRVIDGAWGEGSAAWRCADSPTSPITGTPASSSPRPSGPSRHERSSATSGGVNGSDHGLVWRGARVPGLEARAADRRRALGSARARRARGGLSAPGEQAVPDTGHEPRSAPPEAPPSLGEPRDGGGRRGTAACRPTTGETTRWPRTAQATAPAPAVGRRPRPDPRRGGPREQPEGRQRRAAQAPADRVHRGVRARARARWSSPRSPRSRSG